MQSTASAVKVISKKRTKEVPAATYLHLALGEDSAVHTAVPAATAGTPNTCSSGWGSAFRSHFVLFFNCEGIWNFVTFFSFFFCSFWEDLTVFLFYCVNMAPYSNWFLNVNPNVSFWDKPYLHYYPFKLLNQFCSKARIFTAILTWELACSFLITSSSDSGIKVILPHGQVKKPVYDRHFLFPEGW